MCSLSCNIVGGLNVFFFFFFLVGHRVCYVPAQKEEVVVNATVIINYLSTCLQLVLALGLLHTKSC
jgi:hypothetical protein